MALTLEERVEAIEQKVALITDGLSKAAPDKKAWLATVGLSKNDPGFDEMIRLGQAYREEIGQLEKRTDS